MIDTLKNLQKELAFLLISILISVAALLISYSLWQTSTENRNTAENNLNDEKIRYRTALNQKRLLEQFEDRYIKLEKQGIAGNEKRLDWVNAVEQTTRKFKIPYVKYKIEKQIKLKSAFISQNYPGIDIYKSTMTLTMQLLHEGDLYSVINNIEKEAQGLFDIQSCIISRNSGQVDSVINSSTNKNFASICKLNWYTMTKQTVVLPTRRDQR